jgi:hypothetical protein
MRKIERLMLEAIEQRKDWKLANTEVQCVYFPSPQHTIDRINVRLHGHTIATITPDKVEVCDCGWQTPTTKSRLNIILHTLCKGGVYQSSNKWYGVAENAEPWEIELGSHHSFARGA